MLPVEGIKLARLNTDMLRNQIYSVLFSIQKRLQVTKNMVVNHLNVLEQHQHVEDVRVQRKKVIGIHSTSGELL